MAIVRDGGDVHHRSERPTRESGPEAAFGGRYRALGPASPSAADTLVHYAARQDVVSWTLDG